jgi:hypothetical protein
MSPAAAGEVRRLERELARELARGLAADGDADLADA